MTVFIKHNIVKSLFALTVATLLFFPVSLKVPFLDTTTDAYFETAMTKALVAYATCRAINASVSIVKESTLQLEPAGVGISLAIGQILGPVDDMIERLSDVLVMAITSLGVQKLAYEIGITLIPPVLAILLLLFTLLLWFNHEKFKTLQSILLKAMALLLVLRLFLPIASLVNDIVYINHFEERISVANEELGIASETFDTLHEISLPEVDGVLGTLGNSANFVKERAAAMKQAILTTITNMDKIIDTLLELTYLYVGLFIIQVLCIPLLSLWLLIKLVNKLFDTDVTSYLTR